MRGGREQRFCIPPRLPENMPDSIIPDFRAQYDPCSNVCEGILYGGAHRLPISSASKRGPVGPPRPSREWDFTQKAYGTKSECLLPLSHFLDKREFSIGWGRTRARGRR